MAVHRCAVIAFIRSRHMDSGIGGTRLDRF
jgi:hypothetical protein